LIQRLQILVAIYIFVEKRHKDLIMMVQDERRIEGINYIMLDHFMFDLSRFEQLLKISELLNIPFVASCNIVIVKVKVVFVEQRTRANRPLEGLIIVNISSVFDR
jgi:hypothetical protein